MLKTSKMLTSIEFDYLASRYCNDLNTVLRTETAEGVMGRSNGIFVLGPLRYEIEFNDRTHLFST